jgi:hypothetical protein
MFLDYISVDLRGMAMQLLFYSSGVDENSTRLGAAIHEVIPEGRIKRFNKLDDLRERLRTVVDPDSVAVLSAGSREELRQMLLLRKLLPEIYVILVLPDLNKGTLKIAHYLLPRFLSQKDSDFADFKVVLNKMYVNSQHSHNGEILRGS